MEKDLYLGVDTSNYTTSLALVDEDNNAVSDLRKQLEVGDGMKGLRQSEALFRHWSNLPEMFEETMRNFGSRIAAVTVSVKPRPREDSYMPVFRAGRDASRIFASALGIPLFECSHQEGHIKAASIGNSVDFSKPLLSAHLSGGTLEIVLIADEKIALIGGTGDISYGKLLDRLGVALGFRFPAGADIDKLACGNKTADPVNPFVPAFVESTRINLSGLETQLIGAVGSFSAETLAYYAMDRISESFVKLAEAARKMTGVRDFLVTGGMAQSRFLRHYCEGRGYVFGDPGLCGDNAVGVAALKGGALWD